MSWNGFSLLIFSCMAAAIFGGWRMAEKMAPDIAKARMEGRASVITEIAKRSGHPDWKCLIFEVGENICP